MLQAPFLPSPQNLTAQFCRVTRRRKLVGIDIVRQGLGMRTSQRQIVGDRPPIYGKVHGEIRHENMKTRSLVFRILTRALGYLLVDSTQKNMGRWGSSSHSSLKRKRRCLKPPVKRSGQWTVVHQPEMQELLFPYEPPSMVTSILKVSMIHTNGLAGVKQGQTIQGVKCKWMNNHEQIGLGCPTLQWQINQSQKQYPGFRMFFGKPL